MAEINANLAPYVPRSYFDAKGQLLVPVATAESAAKSVEAHVQSLPAAEAELFLALLQEPDLAPRPAESTGALDTRLDSLQKAVETIDKFYGLAEDVNLLATLLIKHGNSLQKEALDSRLEARVDAKNELMKQAGQMQVSADKMQSGAVTSLAICVASAAVSIGMSAVSMRASVKSGLALKDLKAPVAPTPPTPTPPTPTPPTPTPPANTPNPGAGVAQTTPPPTVDPAVQVQNPTPGTTDPSTTTPTSSEPGVEQPPAATETGTSGQGDGSYQVEELQTSPDPGNTVDPVQSGTGNGTTGEGSGSNTEVDSLQIHQTTVEETPTAATADPDPATTLDPAQSGTGNGTAGEGTGSNSEVDSIQINQTAGEETLAVATANPDPATALNPTQSGNGNGTTGEGSGSNDADTNSGSNQNDASHSGEGVQAVPDVPAATPNAAPPGSENVGAGNETGGTTTTANKGSVSDADKLEFDAKKMEFESGKMKFDADMAEVHAGNSTSQHFSTIAGIANTLGQASSGYVSTMSQADAKMADATAAEYAAIAQNILADADLAKDTQDNVRTFVSRMMDVLAQNRSLKADRFQSFTKV